jgi:hypothetical protein
MNGDPSTSSITIVIVAIIQLTLSQIYLGMYVDMYFRI